MPQRTPAQNLRFKTFLALAAAVSTPAAAFGQFNTGSYRGDYYSGATSYQTPAPAVLGPLSPANTSASIAPSTSAVRTYKLGAYVQHTDIGALVTGVEPNSAAARAGIEPDDLIVNINGQQVGNVMGRLYDVGYLVTQLASNGRVRALVADNRTGRLQNIDVDLEPAAVNLAVTAQLPERANLSNAVLSATVRNTSRPHYEVNGGRVSQQVSGGGPFRMNMTLDPATVWASDQYALNVQLTDARGQLLYHAQAAINLPSSGDVALSLPLQRSGGQVVQVGYPSQVDEIFREVLERTPSAGEREAWVAYLAQGNSVDDMRIHLLGTPIFFDDAGNDPKLFVDRAMLVIRKRRASKQEIDQWVQRLYAVGGNREQVVRDMYAAYRAGR